MWRALAEKILDTLKNNCRLRSPQFHVARDGESERGSPSPPKDLGRVPAVEDPDYDDERNDPLVQTMI